MRRKLNAQEIIDRVQRITDEIRLRYFTGPVLGLEFVPIKLGKTRPAPDSQPVGSKEGKPKDCYGEYGLKGSIKLSYKWISRKAMCRMLAAASVEEYQTEWWLLKEVIFHEQLHCLVHRKHGQSPEQEGHSKWDEREGHSNWFLFYVHQLCLEHGIRLDLSGVYRNWRETEQIYKDIERGYHPAQSLDEWRKQKAEADLRRPVLEADLVAAASGADADEDGELINESVPPKEAEDDHSPMSPDSWWWRCAEAYGIDWLCEDEPLGIGAAG